MVAAGASPAAARADRKTPTCSAMVSAVAWGLMSQASPSRAARSTAAWALAAIQIGGRGRCTGRTFSLAPASLHHGRSALTASPAHRRATMSRLASKRRTLNLGSRPNAAYSTSRYPSPTPKTSRPPESTSSDAHVSATSSGLCRASSRMPMPTRMSPDSAVIRARNGAHWGMAMPSGR